MGNRVGRAFTLICRALLDIKEGISSIMGQLEDLKTANAAEAAAVESALAQLKLDAEEHAADVAALAAKAAANPDLTDLIAGLNARAQSISLAVSNLHASVTAPTADTVAGAASVEGASTVAGADTIAAGVGADTVEAGTADTVVGATGAESVPGA